MAVSSETGFARWTPRQLLGAGLWFGLMAGLLEATILLAGQKTGFLNWYIKILPINNSILWASPLTDVSLFLLVALLLCAVKRWLPKQVPLVVFATMACYLVISAPDRLREGGAAALALGVGVTVDRLAARQVAGRWAFFGRTLRPVMLLAAVVMLAAGVAPRVREWASLAGQKPAVTPAPHVLLIVVDTLRADRVGAYGYQRPTTPFLDRLANESVRFEYVIANSSWTLPSHASMFTGLLPFEHGAARAPLPEGRLTLAEVMRDHGYATAGFVANGRICTQSFGLAQGFQRWENIFNSPQDAFFRTVAGRKVQKRLFRYLNVRGFPGQMNAEEIVDRFTHWLDRRPNKPFFAFLNFMDTHQPHTPPQEFMARFSGYETPAHEDANHSYDAALAYVDSQLERLFKELRGRNLDQELLVILTSDHGESLGDHGLAEHFSSLYLEQIRVPLIIHFPGRAPGGTVVRNLVGLNRLAATVASLAGLGEDIFRGPSLASEWSAQPPAPAAVISELDAARSVMVKDSIPNAKGWLESVITSEWHLIRRQDQTEELFRWSLDPAETQNVASDPQFQEHVVQLRRQLPSQSGKAQLSVGKR